MESPEAESRINGLSFGAASAKRPGRFSQFRLVTKGNHPYDHCINTPPGPWCSDEYFACITAPDPHDGTQTGKRRECFRIYPCSELANPEEYIAETNEGRRSRRQSNRRPTPGLQSPPRRSCSTHSKYFFNIMHDYQSSVRKGYVKHAMDLARAAIAVAKGGAL